MPIRGAIPYDIKSMIIKLGFLFGGLIIVYAIIWMLAELRIIPPIIYIIFPQIVLLLIGIFIIYVTYTKRKEFY